MTNPTHAPFSGPLGPGMVWPDCVRALSSGKKKAVSSDKLVGSGLLLLSVLIFVYYTVWVIVLVSPF